MSVCVFEQGGTQQAAIHARVTAHAGNTDTSIARRPCSRWPGRTRVPTTTCRCAYGREAGGVCVPLTPDHLNLHILHHSSRAALLTSKATIRLVDSVCDGQLAYCTTTSEQQACNQAWCVCQICALSPTSHAFPHARRVQGRCAVSRVANFL